MTITQTVLNDIFKSFSARFNAGYNAEIDPREASNNTVTEMEENLI